MNTEAARKRVPMKKFLQIQTLAGLVVATITFAVKSTVAQETSISDQEKDLAAFVGSPAGSYWDVYVKAAETKCLSLPAPSKDELYAIYDRALKPLIRETKRPIPFFHYGWRTKRPAGSLKPGFWDNSVAVPSDNDPKDLFGPVSPDATGPIQSYIDLHLRGHFEAIHQTQEQLGDGLYVAPDPIQSIGYSGNPGLLLKLTVPAGTRYVDMRKPHTSWPVSKEEAFKVHCQLYRECHESNPSDPSCTGLNGVISRFVSDGVKGTFSISPRFVDTQTLGPVIKKVYIDNQIDALAAIWGNDVYPECNEVKKKAHSENAVLNFAFINPEMSKKLAYELLVPVMEQNPSPKKRVAYLDVMKYFDALDVQETFKGAESNKEIKESLDTFWEYYKAWAIPLYNLPSDVNIEQFQLAQREKMKSLRNPFLEGMYGCSPDPAYADEIAPGRKDR